MGKIPVFKTIAYAYSFLFGEFPTIIGLVWVPYAILFAGVYFLQQPYVEAAARMATSQDSGELMSTLPLMLAYVVVSLICVVMAAVAVTRQALGLRTGGAVFYFSLGPAVWRVLGAYILLILAYIALVLVAVVAVAIIAAGVKLAVNDQASAVVVGTSAFAAVIAFVFIGLRLGFLLVPVTVAENHISLRRGWELTRGNFWRIFFIALTIVIPILFLEFILLSVVAGPDAFSAFHTGMTPEQIDAAARQFSAHVNGSLALRLGLIGISILSLGLMAGANSFAYRALVPVGGGKA